MSKQIVYRFAFSKITVIFLSAALLGGIAVSFTNDIFAFVKPSKAINVVLAEEASLYELSVELQENGVIENALCFWLYAAFTDAEQLAACYGSIDLNSAMSYRDIINKLKNIQNI